MTDRPQKQFRTYDEVAEEWLDLDLATAKNGGK